MSSYAYISGYAALFNTPDQAGDIIQQGAFAENLLFKNYVDIKMLYQHDITDPLGVWLNIVEDNQGLFVQGRLSLDADNAARIYTYIQDGALDGLSIGYQTHDFYYNNDGNRILTKLHLWEISIVTFPLHQQAKILKITY